MLLLLVLATLLVATQPTLGIGDKCGTSKFITKRSVDIIDRKHCRVSKQCSNGKICKKDDKCGIVKCHSNADCIVKSYLPVRCEQFLPGQSFCVQTECRNDADCKNAAPDRQYGCFLDGQCKPSYGDCDDSCDCVDKYNMKKGEAYCHKNKCYCRTEHLHVCFNGEVIITPPKVTTRPAREIISKVKEVCKPNKNVLSQKGGPCSVHSGCIPWGGLVCIRSSLQEEGTCQDVSCSSDQECESKSVLPLQCKSGWCRPRFCYRDSDCFEGYGCYHGGRCKRILGTCQFHCDCGNCPGIECFKGQCFCQNSQDNCHSIVGKSTVTTHIIKQSKGKSCKPKACPASWHRTLSGCYKVFHENLTQEEAVAKCKAEGGYMAQITSEKELHETKQILGAGHKPVWIGARKTGGTLHWIYNTNSTYFAPKTKVHENTGQCFLYTETVWISAECSENNSVLCEITPLKKN